MNRVAAFCLAVLVAGGAPATRLAADDAAAPATNTIPRLVLVELFTSQG